MKSKLFDFIEKKANQSAKNDNLLVCPIVGRSNSGKDMVASFLQSEFLEKEISSRSESISSVLKMSADHLWVSYSWRQGRQALREIYDQITKQFWEKIIPQILCNETIEDYLIIPWCRWLWQMQRLDEHYNISTLSPTIHVNATKSVRLRIMEKSSNYWTNILSTKERKKQLNEDDISENWIGKLNNVPWCITYCNRVINNNLVDDIKNVEKQVKRIVRDYT